MALLGGAFFVVQHAFAATLLSDNFSGTTIDTAKWTEIDGAGSGGTSGNIQQNGALTITGSFAASTWAQNGLISVDTFVSSTLEISAVMTRGGDQLLGYGDYNFQTAGTKAYIVDLQSGSILALSWNNGSFVGADSCGSPVAGATYKLKPITGGFQVYQNGSLICTHNTSVAITNGHVFLESDSPASTYDDLLVTGTPPVSSAPDAPTALTSYFGNTQARLTWIAPGNNSGAAITDYLVEYKQTATSTWSTFDDGVSTNTSSTVTSLSNGVSYDFRVSAVNSVGTSTPSTVASTTPQLPTAPSPPTGLSVGGGNTQATVSFNAGADGGSPITSYTVTSNPGGITATSTGSPITVTGLTNGQAYTFTVTATNAYGTSSSSVASASVTPAAIGTIFTETFTGTTIDTARWVEVDPNGLGGGTGDVTQNGVLSVQHSYTGGHWGISSLRTADTFASTSLEFTATMSVGSSGLIGYGDMDFDNAANAAYVLDVTAPNSGILALVWHDGNYDNVSCGTDTAGLPYKLKITAAGYEVYQNDVLKCSVTTSVHLTNKPFFLESDAPTTYDNVSVYGIAPVHSAPDAPTSVVATADNQQASVSFTPGASNGSAITSYRVTASPGGSFSTGSSSPLVVTGLTNGQAYTFTVTATNDIGTSVSSTASNSVIPATPPAPDQVTGLYATGVNQQALLSWTEPANNGSAITDYQVEYKASAAASWSIFADGTSTSTKAIVTGLTNATSYDFRVSAINGGGTGAVSTVTSTTPVSIDHIGFVMTGESNSGGIGPNSDATPQELAPRSAVQIENLTSGAFLFENLDIGTNNLRDHAGLEGYYDTSHGFELQLANLVEAHYFPDNDQVYLVKTGHGGSTISQWGVGDTYWTKFLQRTAAAKTQIPANRQWVVWLSLGINDSISGTPTSTWKTAMVAHLNKIKADLPGAIIIMTEFQSMPAGSGYPAYNAVIRELAAQQPNVFSVDTTGAGTDGANHWLYAGLKQVTNSLSAVTQTQLGLVYPGKPVSLAATPGNHSVSLTWTSPTGTGGSAITDYRIMYKRNIDSSYTTFTDGVSTATGTTVTGLTNGVNYDFLVAAQSATGFGNPAAVNSNSSPDTDAPILSSVTVIPAATGATIAWTTDEASDSQVEFGLTTAYTASSSVSSSMVTSHSVTLSGLVACGTYNYRALSTDAATNHGTSTNATFTTTCTGSSTVAQATTSQVTTAGGTATMNSNGYSVTISAPSSFTSSTVLFQIQQLSAGDITSVASAPSGVSVAGSYLYHLTAYSGTTSTVPTFVQPVTVTLSYNPSDIAGLDASSLVIYRYDGSSWHLLTGCSVDSSAHTVSCTTTAFSFFGIFGSTSVPSSSGSSAGLGTSVQSRVRNLLAMGKIAAAQELMTLYPNLFPQVVQAQTMSPTFTRDLSIGITGEDVRQLQIFLNSNGFSVAPAGPGSRGNETLRFGAATKAALVRYQISKGITPATGYFGPMTRAQISGVVSVLIPVNSAPVATVSTTTFTRDLSIGITGEDVRQLQIFLNSNGFSVAPAGPGSRGNETLRFGAATKAALVRYQISKGITPATGYFGPKSRAAIQ